METATTKVGKTKQVARINKKNQELLWQERGAEFFSGLPVWIPCSEETVEANITSRWEIDPKTTGQLTPVISYADARRQGESTYRIREYLFFRPSLKRQGVEYWASKWDRPKFVRAWVSREWPTTAMYFDYQVSSVHVMRIFMQDSMPVELIEMGA